MAAPFCEVSASALLDSTGTPVRNATIIFRPITSAGGPVSLRLPGIGIVHGGPVEANVNSTGGFAIQLVDTSLARPINSGYAVTLIDNETGEPLPFEGYGCFQPTGATLDFGSVDPNLQAGVTVQAGPPGPSGAPGLSGLTQQQSAAFIASVNNKYINAFDATVGFTPLSYIDYTTGALTALSDGTYVSTPFLSVYAGKPIQSNVNAGPDGNSGLAFYDANFQYISGVRGSSFQANVQVTAPATAAYARASYHTVDVAPATFMFILGPGMPSHYIAFGQVTPADLAGFLTTAQTQTLVTSYFTGTNLFSLAAATLDAGVNSSGAVVTGLQGVYASAFIPVVAGQTYNIAHPITGGNSQFGVFFYDANKTPVSAGPRLDYTSAPTVFVIPAGVAYLRFTGFYATDGPTQMLTAGATPPNSYVYPLGAVPTIPAGVLTTSFTGKRMGWFGDSISADFSYAWQNIVAAFHGMSEVMGDARHARYGNQLFENYSGTPQGNNLVRVASTTSPASALLGVTTGHTLAQDLANVDVLFIEIWTNTPQNAYGAATDGISAGTAAGDMNANFNAIFTAKPGIQVFWIVPYQANPAAAAMATQAQYLQLNALAHQIAKLWGVTVIDPADFMNLNPATWSLLLRDGVHPSALGFTAYGGGIARSVTNAGR